MIHRLWSLLTGGLLDTAAIVIGLACLVAWALVSCLGGGW